MRRLTSSPKGRGCILTEAEKESIIQILSIEEHKAKAWRRVAILLARLVVQSKVSPSVAALCHKLSLLSPEEEA